MRTIVLFCIIIIMASCSFTLAEENNQKIIITEDYADKIGYFGDWLNIGVTITGGSGIYWYGYRVEEYISDEWVVTDDMADVKNLLSGNELGFSCETKYGATKFRLYVKITDSNSDVAEWTSQVIPIRMVDYDWDSNSLDIYVEQPIVIFPDIDHSDTSYQVMALNGNFNVNRIYYYNSQDRETWAIGVFSYDACSDTVLVFDQNQNLIKQISVNVHDYPSIEEMSVINLPSSLEIIKAEAFSYSGCQGVIIPDGCAEIGDSAFKGCSNLIYIKIPDSVKILADNAFDGCNKKLIIDW